LALVRQSPRTVGFGVRVTSENRHGVGESGPLRAVQPRNTWPGGLFNMVGKLQPPSVQGFSAEQVPISAYGGSLKNLKDLSTQAFS